MKPNHEDVQLLLPMPLGAQIIDGILEHPLEEVRELATGKEGERILEAVQYVLSEDPRFGFLHSALCALSLPVRKPDDEFSPIIRRDGNLSLIIRPLERARMIDGELVDVKVGVPYGVHARLVMLFIMTEAVRLQSREIFLGKSFAAWLRRMGITSTNSGGPRGSRALVQDQVDRLMSCEWTIRWDKSVGAVRGKARRGRSEAPQVEEVSAFQVNDMRIVNGYGGVSTGEGEFISHFVLSPQFYDELIRHAVPLNERAFAALKASATQLDLYTWLAFRLPKIKPDEEVLIRWEDLRSHLANSSSTLAKFRQTVRKAWQTVSGVYPQARHAVSFDDQIVRLRRADAPVDNQLVRRKSGHIELVSAKREIADQGMPAMIGQTIAFEPIRFPRDAKIRYGHPELFAIAKKHGKGNDIDLIAERFRKLVAEEIDSLKGERLTRRFTAFCQSLTAPS